MSEDVYETGISGNSYAEGVEDMLCDLRQSESEVRAFGDDVSLRTGKGKGSGTVGFGDGGLRSDIGEFGIGGSRVGGTLGTEVDGSRGLGVGGSGVGGSVGTFGGQFCVPEAGERTFILIAMS